MTVKEMIGGFLTTVREYQLAVTDTTRAERSTVRVENARRRHERKCLIDLLTKVLGRAPTKDEIKQVEEG